jgi:hypothetical protein
VILANAEEICGNDLFRYGDDANGSTGRAFSKVRIRCVQISERAAGHFTELFTANIRSHNSDHATLLG